MVYNLGFIIVKLYSQTWDFTHVSWSSHNQMTERTVMHSSHSATAFTNSSNISCRNMFSISHLQNFTISESWKCHSFVFLVNVVKLKPLNMIMYCFSLNYKVPILANYFFTFSLTFLPFPSLEKFYFQDFSKTICDYNQKINTRKDLQISKANNTDYDRK